MIHSNQIKNFPVTVEDVATASKIWGKNVDALKGKTTRRKPEVVKMYLIKVPKEIMKLHKDIYLTADIFFVNKIPFFLTLLRIIMFTAVHHLTNRTVPHKFNVFKEIFTYYLQRGFRITTIGMDGEFAPLKTLIVAMPGGPHVN